MQVYIVYKIINVPRRIGAVRNWICVCNYWAGLVTNPGYFLISDCHGMKASDTPSRLFEGDVGSVGVLVYFVRAMLRQD